MKKKLIKVKTKVPTSCEQMLKSINDSRLAHGYVNITIKDLNDLSAYIHGSEKDIVCKQYLDGNIVGCESRRYTAFDDHFNILLDKMVVCPSDLVQGVTIKNNSHLFKPGNRELFKPSVRDLKLHSMFLMAFDIEHLLIGIYLYHTQELTGQIAVTKKLVRLHKKNGKGYKIIYRIC